MAANMTMRTLFFTGCLFLALTGGAALAQQDEPALAATLSRAYTNWRDAMIQKNPQAWAGAITTFRQTTIRNEIVGNMIYLIDVEYSKYADDVLQSSKALLDTSLGISGLGLTAAATITGHEATATLLSGIATAVQGSRELIDKNDFSVFHNVIAIALIKMPGHERLVQQISQLMLPHKFG